VRRAERESNESQRGSQIWPLACVCMNTRSMRAEQHENQCMHGQRSKLSMRLRVHKEEPDGAIHLSSASIVAPDPQATKTDRPGQLFVSDPSKVPKVCPDVQVFEFWLSAGIRFEKNMRKTHSLHRASMVDSEGVVARVA
jgi:hypothetical protein